MTTYTHTDRNGVEHTRNSTRAFTHVVIARYPDTEAGRAAAAEYGDPMDTEMALAWSGSLPAATRAAAQWRGRGFVTRVEAINGGTR